MLRVLWLPILDVSHDLLSLGDVVYPPYAAAVYLPVNLGLDIRDQVPWMVMGRGAAIFVNGRSTCIAREKIVPSRGSDRVDHPLQSGTHLVGDRVDVRIADEGEGRGRVHGGDADAASIALADADVARQ